MLHSLFQGYVCAVLIVVEIIVYDKYQKSKLSCKKKLNTTSKIYKVYYINNENFTYR